MRGTPRTVGRRVPAWSTLLPKKDDELLAEGDFRLDEGPVGTQDAGVA